MTSTRVRRVDLAIEGGGLASPIQMANGSWVVEGYATRAGIFRYLNPDGTERLEFRPPDEVEKSAPGLTACPLTNRHPPEGHVTPDSASRHIGGVVLDSRWDAETKRVPVRIVATHRDTLDAIVNGRRELSAGYEATVSDEAGEYEGQAYTHVQRDIRYNHLAIVDAGRAGPSCALRLDEAGNTVADAVALPPPPVDTTPPATSDVTTGNTTPPREGQERSMETEIQIDGKPYKVPEDVAKAILAERAAMEQKLKDARGEAEVEVKEVTDKVAAVEAEKTKLDAAVKELTTKNDSLSAEIRKVKKERNDAAESMEASISKRVNERTELLAKVTPILGTAYDYAKATEQTIRVDALDKLLEGKDAKKKRLAAYVDAKDAARIEEMFLSALEERTDSLGGTHSPPTVTPGNGGDPFAAGAEALKVKQRASAKSA